MNEVVIPYALLRPFNEKSTDIDVLLNPVDVEKVIGLAKDQDLVPLWVRKKFCHQEVAFTDSSLQVIFFDFQFEQLYQRMKLHPRNDVLGRSIIDERGLRVLPSAFQAFTLLVHCILDKGRFGENHLSILEPLMAEFRKEIQKESGKLWDLLDAAWIHRDGLIPKAIKNGLRKKCFEHRLSNLFFYTFGVGVVWLDRARWFKRRPGISVALIGTDGTGKTTQSEGLFEFLKAQNIPVVRYYRAQLVRPKSHTRESRVSPTKEAIKNIPFVGKFFQELNVLWIAFAWAIPFRLKVSIHLYRGHWVVIDRHVFDLITLHRRICQTRGFEVLLRWISFRPDCLIYLSGDPKVIVSRKSDNSLKETQRQMKAYARLQDCTTHRIDVSQEKTSVLSKIIAAAYAASRLRLSKG